MPRIDRNTTSFSRQLNRSETEVWSLLEGIENCVTNLTTTQARRFMAAD